MKRGTIIIGLAIFLMSLSGCSGSKDIYMTYYRDESAEVVTTQDYTGEGVEENEYEEDPAASITEKQYLISAYCLEYDRKIPYVAGGRAEMGPIRKYEDGLGEDEYNAESEIVGLDSEGYVKWLYSTVFGKNIIEGTLASYLNKCTEIKDVRALQVGDICCIEDDLPGTLYGIVAYVTQTGDIIVSVCDPVNNSLFARGSTRLAYIKKQKNEFYGDSEPVAFNKFYKVAVDWEA